MSNIRVYCCGGAGINIGKLLLDSAIDNIDVAMIDSSASNIRDVDEDLTYLIKDMDGAGKVRAKTYDAYVSEIEGTLTTFKPSERLNIVISSLSGGTGSIIAPLITRELIREDKTVIVIGIPSFSSNIEIDNTIKTIQTYNNFSIRANKPVGIIYPSAEKRSEVDKEVVSSVVTLTLIADPKRTEEFDTTDLNHFVNYNKVSDLPVGLSRISIRLNSDARDLTKDKHLKTRLASTILTACDADVELIGEKPEYLATVVITDPDYVNNEKRKGEIRIDNHIGVLKPMVDELESNLTELRETHSSARFGEIELIDAEDDVVL